MSTLQSLKTLAASLGAVGWLSCAQIDQRSANKAVVRGYMEEILNNGNFAAADIYFPEEGVTLNGRLITRDELPALRQGMVSRFPDFHLTIEDQIAEGDKVVTRGTFRGTHLGEFRGIAPTGKKVRYAAIAIDRLVDGKVVEGWHQADQLGLLRQLGVALGQQDQAERTGGQPSPAIRP